jgi:flagellar biosynthesis protein FlhG
MILAKETVHMDETAAPGNTPTPAGTGSLPCRVIAVTSGKGGVGKTNVVANLAVVLARRGQRVIVLDADLGLANIDVLLGLNPAYSLLHVLRGERRMVEVAVPGPAGVQVIPAATGIEELTHLDSEERLLLLDQMDGLEGTFDVLLIDTAAGISSNVLYFNTAAHEIVVMVTPEPTALTDAYALMKVLATRHQLRHFLLLVNQAAGEGEARRTYAQIARVVERFLGVGLEYVGYIPFDDAVRRSVREQVPVVERAPASPVGHALGLLADRLIRRPPPARPTGASQFLFRSLLAQPQV